jgi:hypothetical protein
MRGFAYPMALFLLPAVRGSRNERGPEAAHSLIARAGRCVGPASRPPEPGCCCLVLKPEWLGRSRGGPEEARQFTGDRAGRDVVLLPARFHRGVRVMQALLGTVGDLQDVIGQPFLAVA